MVYVNISQRRNGHFKTYSKLKLSANCYIKRGITIENLSKSIEKFNSKLLAFLKDGSNSGLADPSQFVALCGSKQKPQSVLLRDKGRHVELVFCGNGQQSTRDNAGITDIQLEIAAEQPELSPRWFSMMDGQLRSDQLPTCHGTCFTAKDGGDYQL